MLRKFFTAFQVLPAAVVPSRRGDRKILVSGGSSFNYASSTTLINSSRLGFWFVLYTTACTDLDAVLD